MAEIGETNIEVQRSANGTDGWITYTTVPKQTNYDSTSHCGIVKKCAVREYPKSEIDRYQAAW